MRFATVALCLSSCFAQTAIDLAHQSRSADFSSMAHTRPAQVGTSLPALCSLGEVYFKSDASPGKNLYVAASASPCTWTQVAPTTTSTPGGSPGQIQYNNAGSFAGFTVSGDGALNTSAGALTITKTNGTFFAPSATTDTTNASNISSGTLSTGRLPASTGDVSSVAGSGTISVVKINGTSVPANAPPDTVLSTIFAATGSWLAIPNCQDSTGNHLNYNTTTHAFSCGTTGGIGGGGTPGGTPGQIQFNNSGSFSGFTMSGDGTLNASTGSLTITKINGAPFAPSATTDTTNATNIISGTLPGGRMPGLSGDVSSSAGSTLVTVPKVNGTSVAINSAADQVLGTTASAMASWFALPNCQDSSGNHLNYNTAAHAFSCGTTASGTGGGSPGGMPEVDDAGTAANVYAGCPAGSPTLTDGIAILFRAKNANTSNSTFAYCGGATKKLMNSDGTELGGGHMPQSPIALWTHTLVKVYTGANQSLTFGDLVSSSGNNYMVVKAGTNSCSGCLGDTSWMIPVTPRTVMLVYHQQIDWWEIHSLPRVATNAEAINGTDYTTTVTPNQLLQSINQNAPLAAATPNKYQTARFNGSSWTASEPPANPGSGRVGRRWIVDGSTILKSDGMLPSLTGCSSGPTVLTPTAVRPMMLQYSSNGTVPGSYCYLSNGSLSPTWAGTTIKFDTQIQVSATANISYLAGVAGSAVAQSTSPLSYSSGNYAAPLAAFRFNTAAGDARWKCVASVDGTTPVVADTGTQGTVDGNVHQFQIFIDDVMNTMHFYIDATEVCTGMAWGPELPAASAMTPYLGMYQTSSFGSAQTLAVAYVWLEANR
jgi:hypothetical protein